MLSDDDARRDSLLPGWTVGHVLTHLARNAEAMVRRIEGALAGEAVEQYAGGAEGRAAEINSGAGRPISELVADVLVWSGRFELLLSGLADEAWDLEVRTVAGGHHSIDQLPFRRWREVEVHLVDMHVGAEPSGWPMEFVDRALPNLLKGLSARTDERTLAAWILGRGPAPALEPWG